MTHVVCCCDRLHFLHQIFSRSSLSHSRMKSLCTANKISIFAAVVWASVCVFILCRIDHSFTLFIIRFVCLRLQQVSREQHLGDRCGQLQQLRAVRSEDTVSISFLPARARLTARKDDLLFLHYGEFLHERMGCDKKRKKLIWGNFW